MHELIAAAVKWVDEQVRESHAVDTINIDFESGDGVSDPSFRVIIRDFAGDETELDVIVYDWPDWESAKTLGNKLIWELENTL